jgi:hypothetical protein
MGLERKEEGRGLGELPGGVLGGGGGGGGRAGGAARSMKTYRGGGTTTGFCQFPVEVFGSPNMVLLQDYQAINLHS